MDKKRREEEALFRLSIIGPVVSRHIPERGLRAFLSAVLLLIGLRYIGLL